ncbi:MAG TPA: carbohydrate kinase family protein [Longimicrobium sp.]|nr:carbohydrate kinase family protein [Longimicrobium sp.]
MTKRLGVLGTFVWDTIWTLDDVAAGRPFESWGGMAYSLAAAAVACPGGWEIAPIAKVGGDLVDAARAFMAALPGVTAGDGIVVVPEPNNRVELRYTDDSRRGERLTGGVPAWTWDELAPRVAGLDALYVNFFSGFEMGLETAERLRAHFRGQIYADLHSLFLGCPGAGVRARRSLPEWERWVACFDVVQLNEEELGTIGEPGLTLEQRAARVAAAGAKLVLVTMGAEGAGALRTTALMRYRPSRVVSGDPTGAGDVWGASCCCDLAAGLGLADAIRAANGRAARKLGMRGADGLYQHLLAGEFTWR